MSSPLRASTSRSTPRSSPSRQRLASSRSGRANGHRDSIYSNDSPSRQLWEDVSRIQLNDDLIFKRSLDEQSALHERAHRAALDESLAKHEAVRQSAERARERVDLEIQRERARREQAEIQELEESRKKLSEEEAELARVKSQATKRTEEDRMRLDALKRERDDAERQAEASRQQLERETATRAKQVAQAKEDADRKVREDAAAKERAKVQKPDPPPVTPQQQPQQQPQTNGSPNPAAPIQAVQAPVQAPAVQQPAPTAAASTVPGLVSMPEQRKAVHDRYLKLWRRLKVFRKETEKQCKDAGFKDLGELKRGINTQVGMINKSDKAANKLYLSKIEATLQKAATMQGPMVDIREYLLSADQTALANATPQQAQYPAILLYLLHQFAKRTIRQLIAEGGADTEVCDPIGIIIVQIFARPDYQWQGHSLIDLLWAKYHVFCPQLFGIRAQEGVGEEYFRRTTGLAAGFSAITLRDFSKSKNRNPAPNTLWWESMARILNSTTPQTTHFVILKAAITDFVPRIVQLFGGAGKALIKNAVRVFPGKGPKTVPKRPGEKPSMAPAVMALDSLAQTLEQKYGLAV
ncbi:hypothetical protein LTR17_008644 [Elasticomyces elasticus]|nr:hypothetical protein LTR17_008644 [Elasticomyces elasticus]